MDRLFPIIIVSSSFAFAHSDESWTCKADINYLFRDKAFFVDHNVMATKSKRTGSKARERARVEIRKCARVKRIYHRFPIHCTGVDNENQKSLKSLAKGKGKEDSYFDRDTYMGRHFDYEIAWKGCVINEGDILFIDD